MNCAASSPSKSATGALIKLVQQRMAIPMKMISRVLNCLSKNFRPGTELVLSIHFNYGNKVHVSGFSWEMVIGNDRLPEVMGEGELHKQVHQRTGLSVWTDEVQIALNGKTFHFYHGEEPLFQFG